MASHSSSSFSHSGAFGSMGLCGVVSSELQNSTHARVPVESTVPLAVADARAFLTFASIGISVRWRVSLCAASFQGHTIAFPFASYTVGASSSYGLHENGLSSLTDDGICGAPVVCAGGGSTISSGCQPSADAARASSRLSLYNRTGVTGTLFCSCVTSAADAAKPAAIPLSPVVSHLSQPCRRSVLLLTCSFCVLNKQVQ